MIDFASLSSASGLLTALNGNTFFTGTVGALLVGGVAVWLRKIPAQAWGFAKSRFVSTLTVRRYDTPRFEEIVSFLAARRLPFTSSTYETHNRYVTLGMGSSLARWRGHLLKVSRYLETVGNSTVERVDITFWTRRRSILQAFLTEATHVSEADDQIEIRAQIGGGWAHLSKPKRDLSTVFANSGVVEEVVERIEDFLRREDWYRDRGIPYKLCIVLEGPPGTGKTSLIQALASRFSFRVLFMRSLISIASITDQIPSSGPPAIEPRRNAQDAPPRSMVVIEDIDTLGKVTREAAYANVVLMDEPPTTLFDLLQTLDGFMTPHGLVAILTTNKLHTLDPALLRKGRIDLVAHIGPLDIDAMCRMFLAFHPERASNLQSWRWRYGSSYTPQTGAILQDLILSKSWDEALAALAPLSSPPRTLALAVEERN